MQRDEKKRLKDIEDRLAQARHVLEGLLPIHTQIDRKVKALGGEISRLEGERSKLLQGQFVMSFDDKF